MSALFLPFAVLFWGISLLVWNIGAWFIADERAQNVADAVLISSLRLRVDALETISERWNDVGAYFVEGDAAGRVLVPASYWNVAQSRAETLRKAISGYKGRISAVVTVVAEANHTAREQVRFEKEDAQNLGVVPETVLMRSETNQTRLLAGGWYRREWAAAEAAPQPPEESVVMIETAALWPARRRSRARLRWDADIASPPVRARGNGGFPRQWTQALEGNRVFPHRFPVYAAELRGEP